MLNFLLQEPAQGGGGMSMLLMLGVFIVVMYFFIFLPQNKKAKKEKKFIEELQKGQWIVTKSGIHGRIVEVNDKTFIIDTKAGQLLLEKDAVSSDYTQARYPQTTNSEK